MKIKSFIVALGAIIGIAIYFHQNTMEQKLQKLISDKDCDVGIAVLHGNKQWLVTNHETYPMMSVFKIFVAAAVLDKVEKENVSLDKKILISKDMIYPTYSPLRDKIQNYPYQTTIEELLFYMITQSDNVATDVLISYLGGINALNQFLEAVGFSQIVIKVNERQMSEDIQTQKFNVAQPYDVALFMKSILEGNILSAKQKEIWMNFMEQTQTGKDKLEAGLPRDVVVGHKTGSSDRDEKGVKIGDNDVGFVFLPNGEIYYIAVFLKNSKMNDEKNANLISQISELVYDELN